MYVELEVLKDELGITATGDDAILERAIRDAQAGVEAYTRRVFETGADATRYYGSEALDGQWLHLDADLYSLTSIANGDSSATAVSTDDITLFPMNEGPPYHKLRLDTNSSSVWEVDTDYWIGVTGKWAYCDTPPSAIVRATLRWAGYLYQQKDAPYTRTIANTATGIVEIPATVPDDVYELIDPYVRR